MDVMRTVDGELLLQWTTADSRRYCEEYLPSNLNRRQVVAKLKSLNPGMSDGMRDAIIDLYEA